MNPTGCLYTGDVRNMSTKDYPSASDAQTVTALFVSEQALKDKCLHRFTIWTRGIQHQACSFAGRDDGAQITTNRCLCAHDGPGLCTDSVRDETMERKYQLMVVRVHTMNQNSVLKVCVMR